MAVGVYVAGLPVNRYRLLTYGQQIVRAITELERGGLRNERGVNGERKRGSRRGP